MTQATRTVKYCHSSKMSRSSWTPIPPYYNTNSTAVNISYTSRLTKLAPKIFSGGYRSIWSILSNTGTTSKDWSLAIRNRNFPPGKGRDYYFEKIAKLKVLILILTAEISAREKILQNPRASCSYDWSYMKSKTQGWLLKNLLLFSLLSPNPAPGHRACNS